MINSTRYVLSHRDHALLRAVASGHSELIPGSLPVLIIDGRCCCDQLAGHRLAEAGLLDLPTDSHRTPARLTAAGRALLEDGPEDLVA